MDWKRHSLVMRFFEAPDLVWSLLYFFTSIAAIVALVWIILRIRSWFREEVDDGADSRQMLLDFRDLHRQGDLTEDEYRLIKGRLMKGDSLPPDQEKFGDQSNSNDRD